MRTLVAVAVAAAAVLLTGCSELEDRARDRAEEAVEDVAQDQAQDVLERALAEVPGTCADFRRLPATERSSQAGNLLTAFWLAELETTAPPAETAQAFGAAIEARCAETPEARMADTASQVYASGDFAP